MPNITKTLAKKLPKIAKICQNDQKLPKIAKNTNRFQKSKKIVETY